MTRDEPFLPKHQGARQMASAAGLAVVRGVFGVIVVLVSEAIRAVAHPLRKFLLLLILFLPCMAIVLFHGHQYLLASLLLVYAAVAYGIRQWLGRFTGVFF